MPFNFDLPSLLVFLTILTVLVFVHELGHFLACRWFNIPVEEFAIGFPPRLFGLTQDKDNRWRLYWFNQAPPVTERGGQRTLYSLNILPIGGFVRPEGEDDPSKPRGLSAASKTARLVVLAAGSIFNLIFAYLIFVVGFQMGWPDRVTIAEVAPNSPAASAGLQVNDVVLRVNDATIRYGQQLSLLVRGHLGQPLTFVVERNGQPQTLIVTPRTVWPEGQGPTGIVMGRAITRYDFFPALWRAAEEIGFQFNEVINLPGRLISGQLSWEVARPVGIVAMGQMTGMAVAAAQTQDTLLPLLSLAGMISVALALTNLLPIPALDGGRIMFVLLEAVRGRRVDPEREGMVHFAGLMMLLALMVVITYQDIFHSVFSR